MVIKINPGAIWQSWHMPGNKDR